TGTEADDTALVHLARAHAALVSSAVDDLYQADARLALHSFPTRRSSDLDRPGLAWLSCRLGDRLCGRSDRRVLSHQQSAGEIIRSEEHTSELQSLAYLVCRLLLEKKKADARFAPDVEGADPLLTVYLVCR